MALVPRIVAQFRFQRAGQGSLVKCLVGQRFCFKMIALVRYSGQHTFSVTKTLLIQSVHDLSFSDVPNYATHSLSRISAR